MLSQDEHPVAWAMFEYELGDAHEHLGALIDKMHSAGGMDDDEFAVHLGHVSPTSTGPGTGVTTQTWTPRRMSCAPNGANTHPTYRRSVSRGVSTIAAFES